MRVSSGDDCNLLMTVNENAATGVRSMYILVYAMKEQLDAMVHFDSWS